MRFPFTAFAILLLSLSSLYATTYEELLAAGDAADAAGQTQAALTAYQQAQKLTQKPTATLLVKIAKQQGESMVDQPSPSARKKVAEAALATAQQAVATDPQLADSHLALAVCYGRLLDLVPARTRVEYSHYVKQSTEQALKLDPRSDLAWHMLGRWHQACADLSGITRSIVQIVYGGLPAASYADAIRCFQKAEALNPQRLCHPIELGITLAKSGDKTAARTTLQRGLALPDKERDDPDTRKRGQECLKEL